MEQMEAWKLAGVKFNFADLDGRTPLHVVNFSTFLSTDVLAVVLLCYTTVAVSHFCFSRQFAQTKKRW